MKDCQEGIIDVIITKSVSRFGRNTVDTLNSIRKLKELGVDVFFEKENIHTILSEGEILLTLMSAVAENESIALSENVKWGKRRKYEKGDIESIPWKNITGFDKDENGEIIINEEQAGIIRRVYEQFLDGYGLGWIARKLNEDKITLVNGGKRWTVHHIKSYLTNEKYKGSIIFQKRYVLDPFSKRNLKNIGNLPQYYCENTHPAIIDHNTWECVKLELERQKHFCKEHFTPNYHYSSLHEEFPLTGKIVCSHCGHMLKIQVSNKLIDRGTKYYCCPKHHTGYRKLPKPGICSNGSRILPDDVEKLFISAWNSLVDGYVKYVPSWQEIINSDEDVLKQYRAKVLMYLVKETGHIDTMPYELMLKTLDHIEIGSNSTADVIFLAGMRIRM